MSDDIFKDCEVTTNLLNADAVRAYAEVEHGNEAYSKRNYIRAEFAAIEGSIYGMKRIILWVWKAKQAKFNTYQLLSLQEMELLTERKFDQQQNKHKNGFLSFDENIKFVFKVFAKTIGFVFPVDYISKGWTALVAATKIRNRLTHPKISRDLEVSDNDLKIIKETSEWYFRTRHELITKAHHSIKRQIDEFKKEYSSRKIVR